MALPNALRNNTQQIDTAALNTARGKKGLETKIERFRFFNEALVRKIPPKRRPFSLH
jgi:hypothetical protein